MPKEFPTVGLIGEDPLLRLFAAPATALGVEIEKFETEREFAHCTVISVLGDHFTYSQVRTLETSGQTFRPRSSTIEFAKRWNSDHRVNEPVAATVSVLVALSPHGQASTWAPTGIYQDGSVSMRITPAPMLSDNHIGIAQRIALDLAKESGAVGVVEIEIVFDDGELTARSISLGPTFNGVWTIEGARTSEFEQHLRAILDLPLGDPSRLAPIAVTAAFSGEGNMYRPYLHLMARSPGLKIHQYRSGPGQIKGHVTAMGSDLLDLRECVTHAVEYMSGEIDE